jgi:hypothetical protein
VYYGSTQCEADARAAGRFSRIGSFVAGSSALEQASASSKAPSKGMMVSTNLVSWYIGTITDGGESMMERVEELGRFCHLEL